MNIFAAFVAAVAWYLFGAFVATDFNIAHWDPLGRFFIAICGVFTFINIAGGD